MDQIVKFSCVMIIFLFQFLVAMNVNGNFYLKNFFSSSFLNYLQYNILSYYTYILLFYFFITAIFKCVQDSDCPKYYCLLIFKTKCSMGWCTCVSKYRMISYD